MLFNECKRSISLSNALQISLNTAIKDQKNYQNDGSNWYSSLLDYPHRGDANFYLHQ